MTELDVYVSTFNCGRKKIDVDFFAASFFNGLRSSAIPPDLIVLCLQEVAPIAYSFLSASMIAPFTSRFQAAISAAATKAFGADGGEYSPIIVRHVGMTAIMLLARLDFWDRVRGIETAGVGVGLWEMGNKGAVAVRLWLEGNGDGENVPLTFMSAHLAPGEGGWMKRNEDWKHICQRLIFTGDESATRIRNSNGPELEPLLSQDASLGAGSGDEHSLASPLSHIFLAGDLNYRTSDVPPQPDDHVHWPSPKERLADQESLAAMFEQDQLTRELTAKRTLHLLGEANIDFPPTYKYSSHAQKVAVALAAGDLGSAMSDTSLWAKHRTPSWCDRVLFLEAARPKVNSYVALPVQPTSDHRPVALSFSMPLEPLKLSEDVRLPFGVDREWKTKRAAARRYELMVGVAAYLTLTYDGNALIAATVVAMVGGYFALRAITT